MKKILLLAAVGMTAIQVSAQDMWLAPGAMFSKASEDGRYFVMEDEGCLYLYDVITEEFNVYEAEYSTLENYYSPYYSVGFGNAFSADNVMVGNYDECQPAYLKDGEWYMLPVTEEDATRGNCNSADAITPDGKRICGGIARDAFSVDAQNIMMVPVIWDLQANGEYGMYTVLPHPEKDFSGRTPQYITARGISDDGKTIIGQIMDYSGMSPMPIVYREAADGTWSYELPGASMMYDTNAVFPEYPTYPKEPEAALYLEGEALEAYKAACEAYDQAVEDYWNGLIDDYPTEPDATQYMTEEAKALYEAAMAEYQEQLAAYYDALDAFDDVFYDPSVVYGGSFEFNNGYISRDGKYLATTFVNSYEDPDAWFGYSVAYQPCRFDLTNAEAPVELAEETNALATSIQNNGTVLYSTPADEYLRDTYLMPAGSTSGIALDDYVASVDPELGAIMKETLTFQVAEFDEEWNTVPGEEKVCTGTACSNGAGTLYYSWIYNSFYGDYDWYIASYILTLDNVVKLDDAQSHKVTSAIITDLNGHIVNMNGSVKDLASGIYMITTTTADGRSKTQKVIKH